MKQIIKQFVDNALLNAEKFQSAEQARTLIEEQIILAHRYEMTSITICKDEDEVAEIFMGGYHETESARYNHYDEHTGITYSFYMTEYCMDGSTDTYLYTLDVYEY